MYTKALLGFPDGSDSKEIPCSAGDLGSIPGSGRSPGEGNGYPLQYSWASPVLQLVKNLPAVQETWVPSLGWENPLEKGKATHSVFWPGEFHVLKWVAFPFSRASSQPRDGTQVSHIAGGFFTS